MQINDQGVSIPPSAKLDPTPRPAALRNLNADPAINSSDGAIHNQTS
jgi:hypothetical protein